MSTYSVFDLLKITPFVLLSVVFLVLLGLAYEGLKIRLMVYFKKREDSYEN